MGHSKKRKSRRSKKDAKGRRSNKSKSKRKHKSKRRASQKQIPSEKLDFTFKVMPEKQRRSISSLGFHVISRNNRVYVTSIDRDSEAYQKLKVRDHVKKVDDHTVTDQEQFESLIRTVFDDANRKDFRISVRREKVIQEKHEAAEPVGDRFDLLSLEFSGPPNPRYGDRFVKPLKSKDYRDYYQGMDENKVGNPKRGLSKIRPPAPDIVNIVKKSGRKVVRDFAQTATPGPEIISDDWFWTSKGDDAPSLSSESEEISHEDAKSQLKKIGQKLCDVKKEKREEKSMSMQFDAFLKDAAKSDAQQGASSTNESDLQSTGSCKVCNQSFPAVAKDVDNQGDADNEDPNLALREREQIFINRVRALASGILHIKMKDQDDQREKMNKKVEETAIIASSGSSSSDSIREDSISERSDDKQTADKQKSKKKITLEIDPKDIKHVTIKSDLPANKSLKKPKKR